MKLKINPEYAKRHLFVTVLMLGLGLWFAYDGLITYPSLSASELYKSIEKSDPPASMSTDALEKFKTQKTQTQYGFAALSLLAALIVGFRLSKSWRFAMDFDEDSFTVNGQKFSFGDISSVNLDKWETKRIAVITLKNNETLTLDAWHHVGVKEFIEKTR